MWLNIEKYYSFGMMARDWAKFEHCTRYINTSLHIGMRVSSRFIIHTVEMYHFVKSILSKNVISYCFCLHLCAMWLIWHQNYSWFDESYNGVISNIMYVICISHVLSLSRFVFDLHIAQNCWICIVLCAVCCLFIVFCNYNTRT